MDNWTIIIQGKGRCCTGNHEKDADLALHRFIDDLQTQGQTLDSVSFSLDPVNVLKQRESIERVATQLKKIENLPSRLVRIADGEELELNLGDGTYSFVNSEMGKRHQYSYEFLMVGINAGKFDIRKRF